MKLVYRLVFVFTITLALYIRASGQVFDYKMHYPQLPDSSGWKINATYPMGLADNWQCTESGMISEFDFWGGWLNGQAGMISQITVAVFANNLGSFPTWYQSFTPENYIEEIITPGPSQQLGWYDPYTGLNIENDNNTIIHYTIRDPYGFFFQDYGETYWFAITVNASGGTWGWISSNDHWNGGGFWSHGIPFNWHNINDPLTPSQELDLSFVIARYDPVGACCMSDGSCDTVAFSQCQIYGGIYHGEGTACLGDIDPPNGIDDLCQQSLQGACCYPDGSCGLETEENCVAMNGMFSGPYTDCLGDNDQNGIDDNCESLIYGACCYTDGSCGFISVSDCQNSGGTFMGILSECLGDVNQNGVDDACEGYNLGACCLSDGSCSRLTEDECIIASGVFQGIRTGCLGDLDYDGIDDACEQQQPGACCLSDGSCLSITLNECLLEGGVFGGEGTECLGDQNQNGVDDGCEGVNLGACCLPDGACVMVTQNACDNLAGVFQGVSSLCMGDENQDGIDDACEQSITGACCLPNGSCMVTSEQDCNGAGGVFYGVRVECLGDNDQNGIDDLCENPAGCQYVSGDANDNGAFNGIDVSYMVNYLKGIGPVPPGSCNCPPHGIIYAAADANGNCAFNGIDVSYAVNFLKGIGPAPIPCPACPPALQAIPPIPAILPGQGIQQKLGTGDTPTR